MQLDLPLFGQVSEATKPNEAKQVDDWLSSYRAHLKSAKWKKLRKAKLDEAHGQCQKCGAGQGRREVHHKSYERLGDERLEDLIVLCPDCHAFEDKIRAIEGGQRSRRALAAAVYSNGLNTYMTKKYGEDWQEWQTTDADNDEFSEWLEQKRESADDGRWSDDY